MAGVYPLKFEPIIVPKPWGGHRIAPIHPESGIDGQTRIGESWEFVDLPGKSSVIANGPWKGRTFAQCVAEKGEALISDVRLTTEGGYPLLVKYLDALEDLSVQVHPPSGQGAKTEAMYILEADDGAVIYRGFESEMNEEKVRQAIEDGTIVENLHAIRARADRCYFMPGGTCHAYGKGLFGVEVQTPSETTYRVYDWDRGNRDLHIDEALRCMTLGPADVKSAEKRTHVASVFTSMSLLCSCEYFTIEKVRMAESWEQEIPYDRPAVWVVLSGKGRITGTPGDVDVEFQAGEVLLVPPNMPKAKVILDADTQWLDVQIPHGTGEMRLA